ncbi:MAG: hypothetical protein LBO65_08670 [Spirochaetaceae bacterium]|jgi:hypothetical protein|nr:hypothetical protein [Spirochaetaceae bacterium]
MKVRFNRGNGFGPEVEYSVKDWELSSGDNGRGGTGVFHQPLRGRGHQRAGLHDEQDDKDKRESECEHIDAADTDLRDAAAFFECDYIHRGRAGAADGPGALEKYIQNMNHAHTKLEAAHNQLVIIYDKDRILNRCYRFSSPCIR